DGVKIRFSQSRPEPGGDHAGAHFHKLSNPHIENLHPASAEEEQAERHAGDEERGIEQSCVHHLGSIGCGSFVLREKTPAGYCPSSFPRCSAALMASTMIWGRPCDSMTVMAAC